MSHHASGSNSGNSDSRRPKLLFLAQRLPYPPDSGVSIRAFHTLRLLAKAFDVSLISFHRAAGVRSASELDGHISKLREIVSDVAVFSIPQEGDRLRWVLDHLQSVLTARPYTEFLYESEGFRKALVERVSMGAYDVVHMDSMDLVGYLPVLGELPVVCAHHNVESELLRRRAAVGQGWLKAAYLRLQARLLERAERKWCPRVALNVVVSELDRDALQRLAPAAVFTIVPNGVDDDLMRPQGPGDDGIVFVGGTTWFPNRDALEYFADDILPLIRLRRPDVPVVWVGRAGQAEQVRFAGRGIQFTGYVDDIRPYVGRSACFVVPLRVGGGTRLKILDAWSMGKAVVSTRIGAEGLRATDGENILLRDHDMEFADAVVEVLANSHLRMSLGQRARSDAAKFYSWDSFGGPMIEAYVAAIKEWCPKGQGGPMVETWIGPE